MKEAWLDKAKAEIEAAAGLGPAAYDRAVSRLAEQAVREREAARRRGDTPFPGAVPCPACWGSTPRHTATFNRVTHHDESCGRYCLSVGLGSGNIGAAADGLADAVSSWTAREAEANEARS